MCVAVIVLSTAAIPLLGKFSDAFRKQSEDAFKTRVSWQNVAIFSVKGREISCSKLYRQVKPARESWLGSASLGVQLNPACPPQFLTQGRKALHSPIKKG